MESSENPDQSPIQSEKIDRIGFVIDGEEVEVTVDNAGICTYEMGNGTYDFIVIKMSGDRYAYIYPKLEQWVDLKALNLPEKHCERLDDLAIDLFAQDKSKNEDIDAEWEMFPLLYE